MGACGRLSVGCAWGVMTTRNLSGVTSPTCPAPRRQDDSAARLPLLCALAPSRHQRAINAGSTGRCCNLVDDTDSAPQIARHR